MGIGTSMQTAITSTINSIGSTVTITPYTQETDDSGYSGDTTTEGTATTETAVPFEEVKNIAKGNFGDLETGQFQLALKSSATFDITGETKYKITWQSEDYDIIKINRFTIEDTLVAWIITVSKRHD